MSDFGWKQTAFEVGSDGIGRLVTRDVPASEMYRDHLEDYRMSDDQKPWDKVKLPTDEQVERAIEVIRQHPGAIPEGMVPSKVMIVPLLMILLNKDKILGFGRDS